MYAIRSYYVAAFLIPFFESYMTCLVFLEKEKTDKYDVKERAKKLLSFGTKLYKRNQVVRKESLSLINYRNAVNYFAKNDINGSGDQARVITSYSIHYTKLYDVANAETGKAICFGKRSYGYNSWIRQRDSQGVVNRIVAYKFNISFVHNN